MDGGGARPAPTQKRPILPPDGELVELLWRDGAVLARSQAHHLQQRVFGRGGPSGDNTGASGVTGDAAIAAAWLPDGGALVGDIMYPYPQLWHNDIAQLEGRADGDTAASAWPPATSGEVGSSFCGSNDGGSSAAARGRQHLQRGGTPAGGEEGRNFQDEDFEAAADETRPSRRSAASAKRKTRSAEVHNQSERRRRDRINEKMRALVELVPHCNKTDKASILDEAIEYMKSLQMQVQIMWMTTGVAPMAMLPGAHQLMRPMGMNSSSCMPPTTQVLNQMQRVPVPAFMNNPLPNQQMPGVSAAATSVPNKANQQVQKNRMADPMNPFLHPDDAPAATHEVPCLFGYGSQMAHQNEIQELLLSNAAPALEVKTPSTSDGTGTATIQL